MYIRFVDWLFLHLIWVPVLVTATWKTDGDFHNLIEQNTVQQPPRCSPQVVRYLLCGWILALSICVLIEIRNAQKQRHKFD